MRKYILIIVLIFMKISMSYAQVSVGDSVKRNYFDSLNELYASGKISDTAYLHKIDSLSDHLVNQGILYSVSDMLQNLKLYNEIVWSKEAYRPFRKNYYLILLNNAHISNLRGASIYYAEKVRAESEKDGSQRTFIEASVKSQIYALQERNEDVIALYKKNEKQLDTLLTHLKKNPDNFYLEALDVLGFLKRTLDAYAAQKDTVHLESVYNLSKEFIEEIRSCTSVRESDKAMAAFFSFALDIDRNNFYEEYDQTLEILNRLDQLKNQYPAQTLEYIDYSILEGKSTLFLKLKNIDSASFYIEKYLDFPISFEDKQIFVYDFKASLEALKGNHEKAYELQKKALDESFRIQQALSKEMDELLYAQTQAEHHKLALERSEKQKKNRTIWIITLLLTGTVSVVTIYVLMQAKNRKAKKIIQNLNETANIQIAVMEEYGNQVRKEEQKKISQNLHDDLAGTLATLVHRTELAVLKTTDKQQATELVRIKELIAKIFNDVRNNSHNLYEIAHLPGEQMFVEHIQNLAEIAFPGSHYKLNIDIEEYALESATLEFRSELMRVIQEAFTNIVKHAKATQVDLLIYKEKKELIVIVKDNGIGIKGKSDKETLGMKSIEERLKKIGGTFIIKGNKTGVELIISIPVVSS